jgi:hypothetical protein
MFTMNCGICQGMRDHQICAASVRLCRTRRRLPQTFPQEEDWFHPLSFCEGLSQVESGKEDSHIGITNIYIFLNLNYIFYIL